MVAGCDRLRLDDLRYFHAYFQKRAFNIAEAFAMLRTRAAALVQYKTAFAHETPAFV